MTYLCMSEEELALWRQQTARNRSKVPCFDCPAWFRREEQQAGRCSAPSEARLAQMREYAARRGS